MAIPFNAKSPMVQELAINLLALAQNLRKGDTEEWCKKSTRSARQKSRSMPYFSAH